MKPLPRYDLSTHHSTPPHQSADGITGEVIKTVLNHGDVPAPVKGVLSNVVFNASLSVMMRDFNRDLDLSPEVGSLVWSSGSDTFYFCGSLPTEFGF